MQHMIPQASNSKHSEEAAMSHTAPDKPYTSIAHECLTRWIKACDEYHGSSCVPTSAQRKQPHQVPKWVIDIDDACLVSGTTVPRYTALSYTWAQHPSDGHAGEERLMLKSNNLEEFQERGFLNHTILQRLPTVIREAMDLLRGIGERYLWVDCLCICQGDERTQTEVGFMDEIYSGAYFTIIAAATLGLYGKKCYKATGKRWEQWNAHKEFECRLLTTTWASRGWTFQEHLLSKRAMVFLGEGEVFWDCNLCVWDPHTAPTTLEKTIDLSKHRSKYFDLCGFGKTLEVGCRLSHVCWPDMDLYRELACLYNSRDLTYPQDALPAFSGVLHSFGHGFVGGFVNGLPKLFLHAALLWQPHKGKATRRICRPQGPGSSTSSALLPSWSWCGWRCVLDRSTMSTNIEGYAGWILSDPVEWSLVSEDHKLEVSIPEQHLMKAYESLADDGTGVLPSGWSKGKHHRKGRYYFKHEEIPLREFEHPLPLPGTAQSAQPAQRDWPFLSCQTTHTTSLRVRCILRPNKKTTQERSRVTSCMNVKVSVAEIPEYVAGPDDSFCVAVLEDCQGRWAGVLRFVGICQPSGTESSYMYLAKEPLAPGQSVRLIAVPRGSVSYCNLLSKRSGYARDLADEGIDCREHATFYGEGEHGGTYTETRVEFRRDFGGSGTQGAGAGSTSNVEGHADGETSYRFYNVLCVEQKDGIYYRLAAGRVKEAVWDDVCSEPAKIILG